MIDGGFEKTIVYRYDLNPTSFQINELKSKFAAIGVVSKERKIFTLGNIKIHLDKLSTGEQFIEIEAIDREEKFSDADLKHQCHEMKLKLGITDSSLIRTGYLEK